MTETAETPITDAERTVHLRRRFAAPREAVYRAWTDPEEVAQWYGPDGWRAEQVRVDSALGGRWEVTMVRATDGFEFPIGYEIVELDEPSRIVLKHTEQDPGGAEATLVQVELVEDGDGTVMTLTDGPMSVDGKDLADNGYGQAFQKLAALLAESAGNR
jgi:uncharacterized protein YndB with AHSA1/START domain